MVSENSFVNSSSVASHTSKPSTVSIESETTNSNQEVVSDTSTLLTEHMQKVLCETFLEYLNTERKRHGLSELAVDETLQKASVKRAEETTVLFSHIRPNGQDFYTVLPSEFKYFLCGENITVSTYGINIENIDLTDDGLVEIATNAFNNFKKNPPHYENMLKDEYNFTGIAFFMGDFVD